MPAGSWARMPAPRSTRAGMASEGRHAYRLSPANVRPSTAMVLSATEPPRASDFAHHARLCEALTSTTLSTMRLDTPCSWAMRISATVSLGKQEPP